MIRIVTALARSALVLRLVVAVVLMVGGVSPAIGQTDVPSAPLPQTDTAGATQAQQTPRILGILPNFRAVSTTEHLPTQSVREKFVTATQDSFDYSALFVPTALAAWNYGRNSTPEFGSGAGAYAEYWWHSAADQTIENYMVEFVVPVMTKQDTRYYTLGHGGFFKRTGYALSRAVVTRNDAGKETFNTSEVLGAGASAGISNLYYPSSERTVGNTMTNWGVDVGIDSAAFVVKEFWPEINRKLFGGK